MLMQLPTETLDTFFIKKEGKHMLVNLLEHHKHSSINIQDLLIQNKFATRAQPGYAYYTATMMYFVIKALVVDTGRIKELEDALANLLNAINVDKDEGYFLCEEAKSIIEVAAEVLNG